MNKSFDPTGWSRDELKQLADSIYERLSIAQEVNLEKELLLHYQRCKDSADIAYASLAEGNTTAGAAAVLTATTGALKELARLQTDLYNAERVKVLEKCMIDVLRDCTEAEGLLEKFEEMLREQN